MEFDDLSVQVIDTPQFQRLRDLKQLGTSCYVYPGGTHTRFEHSLGVGYLAGCLIERIRNEQKELEITENDVKCLRIAGLCHDLGHGPFSHIFDGVFIPKILPQSNWTHEKGSEMMLESLINEASIHELSTDDVKFIKDLISGEPATNIERRERLYLYDIVANKRNSLDVDKFDYIPRDCYYTGLKHSYDTSRLMKFSRVVDNELCFNQKEVYNIYEMFHTRYTLHKKVYSHKVSKSIEYMHVDALIAADDYLNISSAIHDPEMYLNLTDSIIKEIERSKVPELEKSRSIIQRLRKRDLYKFVDQLVVEPRYREHFALSKVKESDILNHQPAGSNLQEDDIIVDNLVLTYAMKDRNPVDSIKFFNKYRPQELYKIPREQVSLLIPEQYDEMIVRIFTRDATKALFVQQAFRSFLDQKNNELDRKLIAASEMNFVDTVSEGLNLDGVTPRLLFNSIQTMSASFKTPDGSPKKTALTPNQALTLPREHKTVVHSPLKKRRYGF